MKWISWLMHEPAAGTSDGGPLWLRDLARYAACGMGAIIVDYATFGILCRGRALSPVLAQAVSRPCGGIVGFLLNRNWTFRGRNAHRMHVQFLRFTAVWIAMYGFSLALVWLLNRTFVDGELPAWAVKWISKIGADGVAALTGFLLNRFWTFRAS